MKKYLFSTLALILMPFYPALAQVKTGLPGITATSDPTDFIKGMYSFALLIGGVLAFGAIVYGGIRYMTAAGNPSSQTEGREWIQGSIFGLILLFGAYAVLNFINPDITKLSLPTLTPIPASQISGGPSIGGVGGGIGLNQQQAMSQLRAAGIGIAGPIQLAGLKQTTIDEAIRLKNTCNCDVTITSATGGAHNSGACSHSNGYKVDLRSSGSGSGLTNYITGNYQQLPNRSDGAKMYRAPTGVFYALESDHWDMATGC